MEMDGCRLPMLDDTGLEDLKPHTLSAVQHLSQLEGILDRVPPSVIWPTSPSEAQVSSASKPPFEMSSCCSYRVNAESCVQNAGVAVA